MTPQKIWVLKGRQDFHREGTRQVEGSLSLGTKEEGKKIQYGFDGSLGA